VYSVYDGDDCDAARDVANLKVLVEGLQLLEDDYLGGLGSRGSGKVRLRNIAVKIRNNQNYLATPKSIGEGTYDDLAALINDVDDVIAKVKQALVKV
jgi:CRISPR-associated protein Csm3